MSSQFSKNWIKIQITREKCFIASNNWFHEFKRCKCHDILTSIEAVSADNEEQFLILIHFKKTMKEEKWCPKTFIGGWTRYLKKSLKRTLIAREDKRALHLPCGITDQLYFLAEMQLGIAKQSPS